MSADRLTAALQRRCAELSAAARALGLAAAEQGDVVPVADLAHCLLVADAAQGVLGGLHDLLRGEGDPEPTSAPPAAPGNECGAPGGDSPNPSGLYTVLTGLGAEASL